jgi:HlyD family secretion protein
MRRALTIIIVLAVVVAASWFGYEQFGKAKAQAAPDYETVTIGRGDISSTVSATGSVLPEREANLNFQGAGTIAKVAVKAGDRIQTGQVLAELDTTDLELAVRQAEIGLRQTEAQLKQLSEGPDASDVAAAVAALDSAKAAYTQVLKGSDKDQLAAARAQVEQARVSLEQAQQAYDKIKDQPNAGMFPQSQQLQVATINYDTAQANYRVTTRGANASQLAAAQAQIAQAESALDRLKRGASAAQIEIAQAAVDQSQLAVEQAKRRLDNARITAPWDGIVTAVNAVEGTLAGGLGGPAIQIADAGKYHLDVQVDELDVAGLAEGQTVTVEVDALPEQKLTGSLISVAPSAASTSTGGVSYKVRIDIDPTDAALRAGMSATATILASNRADVLLVPNRAVQIERDSGQTFVERLTDGVPQKVEVRLGLRTEQQSEVRDGLAEGEQVIIRNRSSLEKLQQTFQGGGGGGGF